MSVPLGSWVWDVQVSPALQSPMMSKIRSNTGDWRAASWLFLSHHDVDHDERSDGLLQLAPDDVVELDHVPLDPDERPSSGRAEFRVLDPPELRGSLPEAYVALHVLYVGGAGNDPPGGGLVGVFGPAAAGAVRGGRVVGSDVVIRLIGLIAMPEMHTPYDGQYVVDYDPGLGQPGEAWLNATNDIHQARRYADVAAAMTEISRVDVRAPWRYDGEANCPLRAFSVLIEPAPAPVP